MTEEEKLQNEAIGRRIKELRESKGLKRPDLAKAIGVDPNSIYRYETGLVRIKDGVKTKIADFFGVPVTTLLEDDSDSKSNTLSQPATSGGPEDHMSSILEINEVADNRMVFEISDSNREKQRKVRLVFKKDDPEHLIDLMIDKAISAIEAAQAAEGNKESIEVSKTKVS